MTIRYLPITISGKTSIGLKAAKIFDVRGKLIISQKLNSNNTSNTIDTSAIQSGLYLMTIHSKNNSLTKSIIIK